MFPEWVDVAATDSVRTLVGRVTGHNDPGGNSDWPHISFEDWPTSHYTHDFTFHVAPDPASTDLLGWQIPETRYDPCPAWRLRYWTAIATGGDARAPAAALSARGCWLQRRYEGSKKTRQPEIEVEWESGIGASDGGNICQRDNDYLGDSCGFYSAGHRRRELIWNWPTVGDRVTVTGQWIWDRGHPPANTEIHPPRMVAVQRHLPTFITTDPDAPAVLATRVDVFASGDGGAVANNRLGVPVWVRHVPMSDRDYGFDIVSTLPRPSPTAQLRSWVLARSGDTFPVAANITPTSDPARLHVSIPWHSRAVPDTSVFARTIYAWWNQGLGVSNDYHYRILQVTLDKVHVIKSQDNGDGEYRLLLEVGGDYLFMNEVTADEHDILSDGLGDTGGDEDWGVIDHRVRGSPRYAFTVVLPTNDADGFRVHGGGWEADGVSEAFGHLIDPNHRHDDGLVDALHDTVFNLMTGLSGCNDDPIGEINVMTRSVDIPRPFTAALRQTSGGPFKEDSGPCGGTDQNFSFQLFYAVREAGGR